MVAECGLFERADYFRPCEKGLFNWPQQCTAVWSALSQKPTVMVPPLMEGQRATLTCWAPGRCSGSDPEITWKWTGRGNEDSHLFGNITGVTTDKMTGGTFTHASTLMFEATASQHLSNVTCKVSFKNNISTEETITLTINGEYILSCSSSTFLRSSVKEIAYEIVFLFRRVAFIGWSDCCSVFV